MQRLKSYKIEGKGGNQAGVESLGDTDVNGRCFYPGGAG